MERVRKTVEEALTRLGHEVSDRRPEESDEPALAVGYRGHVALEVAGDSVHRQRGVVLGDLV